MVTVTESPLDPGVIFNMLEKTGSGSVLFHYAAVKDHAGGRPSTGIRFEKTADTESELAEIENDIRSRWDIIDILLIRRTGLLQVGDIISLVAVSSTASSDAFDASQYALGMIKKMRNIKKTELYTD